MGKTESKYSQARLRWVWGLSHEVDTSLDCTYDGLRVHRRWILALQVDVIGSSIVNYVIRVILLSLSFHLDSASCFVAQQDISVSLLVRLVPFFREQGREGAKRQRIEWSWGSMSGKAVSLPIDPSMNVGALQTSTSSWSPTWPPQSRPTRAVSDGLHRPLAIHLRSEPSRPSRLPLQPSPSSAPRHRLLHLHRLLPPSRNIRLPGLLDLISYRTPIRDPSRLPQILHLGRLWSLRAAKVYIPEA
jgi:hypothetical protein